jgi:putative phosphoribosyl transferase
MLTQIKRILQNRRHAGWLLAEKLYAYKNSDAVVMAVPQGGVPVGRELAKALGLPFEIIFSRRIKDPANSDISVGAVSLDEVVLQDSNKYIPQSYIYHQIMVIRETLQSEFQSFYSSHNKTNLRGRTVIIVDDVLRETEELTACLNSVRKQNPANIVVAAPVATSRASHLLTEEQYCFVYLFMEFTARNKAYTYFPALTDEEKTGCITLSD